MELAPSLLVEILGFAVLLGAGWWRIGHLENALSNVRDELKRDVRGNRDLIRQQNGRISDLEVYRAKQEAYDEAYERAKRRYGGS